MFDIDFELYLQGKGDNKDAAYEEQVSSLGCEPVTSCVVTRCLI